MDMEFGSFTIDDYPERSKSPFISLSQKVMINGELTDPWNKENVMKQKEEFLSRYKYLYENASLILALYLSDSSNSIINKEIETKCGIKLSKKERYSLFKNDFSVIDYLEELLLGETSLEYTHLYYLIEDVKERNDVFERIKEEYSFNEPNIGFSKYDMAFKTVLDLVESHVRAQNQNRTLYYKKGNKAFERITVGGRLFDESVAHITSFEISHKLSTLDSYYYMLSYSNESPASYLFTYAGFSHDFPDVNRSFVIYNPFLGAFTKYGNLSRQIDRNVFDDNDRKKMYFDLHDELPITFSNCSDDCISFSIKEEDIFYYEDKFNIICPCCGKVQEVKIPNYKGTCKVKERIMHRYKDEESMRRKIELLGELVAIDGYDKYKELIKKK